MTRAFETSTPPEEAQSADAEARPRHDAPEHRAFILYHDGAQFAESLDRLAFWVHNLLIPVYGREVTSGALWCPLWWQHPEAVAQLHALSLAWQELTGPESSLTGPGVWHRDFLIPVMSSLRDPAGPFAGCKPGAHRVKEPPPVAPLGD